MGLLSFFKKGPAADEADVLQIKGQAYDSTAKALPPIKGTLPIQGNGPNTLNDLQRTARLRSDAQLSLSSAYDAAASPAPSPKISRLRSMSLGRPSTAPGGSAAGSSPLQRPKSSSGRSNRDSSRAQKFVTRKNAGPPYLIGLTGPDDNDDNDNGDDERYTSADAPPVPRIADHFKQAPLSPGLTSLKNAPTTSIRTGPGSVNGSVVSSNLAGNKASYVDILDAQGALRPSDFKTRIRAAGVRDYGEDVADRNLGVNGVNLNSPAVMAFYALTGGEALVFKSDGSAVDVHGNRYARGNIPAHLTSQAAVDKDEARARANQSMRVPRFPVRTTSLEPREEFRSLTRGGHLTQEKVTTSDDWADGEKARRRMSVHGSALSSTNPQPRARPLSMHPIVSDFHIDAASIPDIPRSRPTTGSGDATATPPKVPPKARDSMVVAKNQRNGGAGNSRSRSRGAKSIRSIANSQHRDTDSDENDLSGRQRSHSSATTRRRKPGRSRTDETSSFGTVGSHDAIPPLPLSAATSRPGSSGRHDSRPQSQRSWKAPSIGQPSTVPVALPDTSGQPDSRPSSSSSHPRNRSTGGSSVRGRSHLHDITEHIPNRRSSLSISSIPSSSLSSNPFPRPQSRHTADTSLDLSYTLPMKQETVPMTNPSTVMGHARGRGSSATMASSVRAGGYQAQRAQAPSPFATGAVDYYDEYMTTTTDGSDIEAHLEQRQRKRKDGEGLLFKDDAYGQKGLPGLFDDDNGDHDDELGVGSKHISTAPIWSSSLRHPPTHKQSATPTSRPQTSVPRILTSHPPLPSWNYPSTRPKTSIGSQIHHHHPDDDSSSLTVSESDLGGGSSSSPAVAPDTSILSGDSAYDALEQEMDSQLNIKLAVRLRKEMKRRERAVSTARQKVANGKRPAWDAYDQGHIADSEF